MEGSRVSGRAGAAAVRPPAPSLSRAARRAQQGHEARALLSPEAATITAGTSRASIAAQGGRGNRGQVRPATRRGARASTRSSTVSRRKASTSSSRRRAATTRPAPTFAAEQRSRWSSHDNADAMTEGLVADVGDQAPEGGYLAGVLAATMTQTGTLGIVISARDENWHKQAGGFVPGARSVNPDIQFPRPRSARTRYADPRAASASPRRSSRPAPTSSSAWATARPSACCRPSRPPPRRRAPTRSGSSTSSATRPSIDEQEASCSRRSCGTSRHDLSRRPSRTSTRAPSARTSYVLDIANGGISLLQTDHITPEAWAAVEAAQAGIADGSIRSSRDRHPGRGRRV